MQTRQMPAPATTATTMPAVDNDHALRTEVAALRTQISELRLQAPAATGSSTTASTSLNAEIQELRRQLQQANEAIAASPASTTTPRPSRNPTTPGSANAVTPGSNNSSSASGATPRRLLSDLRKAAPATAPAAQTWVTKMKQQEYASYFECKLPAWPRRVKMPLSEWCAHVGENIDAEEFEKLRQQHPTSEDLDDAATVAEVVEEMWVIWQADI
eukprot:TRINITY_DN19227_c0_g1_i3.p1 TRINITY_DN19227_c0_g1~~TRINITY_DN19227_c0_g1_i3.p1  ORF type:complete len:215 (+),score=59.65 TRINITY_DN19227_c0_g1_i3:1-645(+)